MGGKIHSITVGIIKHCASFTGMVLSSDVMVPATLEYTVYIDSG